MIPKFRAWDKINERIVEVSEINFWTKVIDTTDTFLAFSNIELLQSTGLFDKNEKEIFIGDLILTENGVEEVTFTTQNDCYGVYLTDKNAFGTPIDYYATRISSEHIKGEILGNIYQHPHLLEEE